MVNPLVFMFSGQGSQYFHMGRELHERHPEFRRWMLRGEDVVRQVSGRSILAELYSPARKKSDLFDQIIHTHPAIFMVEYAAAQALLSEGIRPDFLLGASLGEVTALCLAGCLAFEETLELISRQAEHLQARRPSGGGMLAIFAPVSTYERFERLSRQTTLCAVNFDGSFVVSGLAAALDSAQADLSAASVLFQRLPLHQAFHSPEIDFIKPFYQEIVGKLRLRAATTPVVSCALAEVIHATTPGHFWEIIRGPIRFQEAIRKLEAVGPRDYIDLGPSGTLATFVKYNLKPGSLSKMFSVMTPFGQDTRNLERLRTEVGARGV